MRIFVGVMLPASLAEAVEALQIELGCGRAVLPENLHLTLLFAGEIDPPAAEALHEALETVSFDAFSLELAGVQLFGKGDRPELVALGIRRNLVLEALQARIAGAARGAGLNLSRRRFRAHVTFARFGASFDAGQAQRLGRFLEARGDVTLPEFDVDRFAMVRSTLGHGPPRYEVLAEYPARGQGLA